MSVSLAVNLDNSFRNTMEVVADLLVQYHSGDGRYVQTVEDFNLMKRISGENVSDLGWAEVLRTCLWLTCRSNLGSI